MDQAPATPGSEITFPPGTPVVIRDAEWVVRSVDLSAAGGQQFLCVGVPELVRERKAIFLTALEPRIAMLDPARTTLGRDRSPRFAELRWAPPNDERIRLGHTAAIDLVPYHYCDQLIISIDTPQRDAEYLPYLAHAWWDIIVVDEAHHVADAFRRTAASSALI